jgi:16S rRNA (guanine966-N2)-methyltransferase
MRLIAGKFAGRQIIAPKGRDTRPTADRTRESLFNILAHKDGFAIEGARVVDLFAGSGAFGLEAMSRGASFCLFVETDSAARGAIHDNIEALGLFGSTRVHRRSAIMLGDKPAGVGPVFTLAFLDPPYGKDLAGPALEALATGGWLADSALVIVEQGQKEDAVTVSGFIEDDRRHYGAAQIGLYKFTS